VQARDERLRILVDVRCPGSAAGGCRPRGSGWLTARSRCPPPPGPRLEQLLPPVRVPRLPWSRALLVELAVRHPQPAERDVAVVHRRVEREGNERAALSKRWIATKRSMSSPPSASAHKRSFMLADELDRLIDREVEAGAARLVRSAIANGRLYGGCRAAQRAGLRIEVQGRYSVRAGGHSPSTR